jgi:REP element-mobilizing transposase RayT
MARHLRVEFPGAIYHVTCRMLGDGRVDRSRLFIDDSDRERLVDRLGERVEEYNIRLYLFVLMTTHFHLVFETPEGNCQAFMQPLLTAYSVYYNLRHGRHGHVFDGRYKAKLVEGDEYLLALTRYVHLNPVHVGSIKRKPIEEKIRYLRQYGWSTYLDYIGTHKVYDFVDYGPILGMMAGKRREWPKRYREFVEAGLAEDDEDFKVALKESPRSIGGDGFRAWIDELYQKLIDKHGRREDIAFRHITEPLDPDTVVGVLADVFNVDIDEFCQRRRNSPLRAVAARYLIRYAGQSQRDVAVRLNAGSGSAISKQLKRYAEPLKKDRRLRRLIKKAEQRLEEERSRQRSQGK